MRYAIHARNILWATLAGVGYVIGLILGFIVKTAAVLLIGALTGFVAATGWTILIGWMRHG